MQITAVLDADGVSFAHELGALLGASDELVVIAPTVRGHISSGLQASPDLDALLSPRSARTYHVSGALETIAYVPRWQRADDQAIAARLVRTDLVMAGATLTEATIAAGKRAALPYRLLPVSDDRAEFRVVIGPDASRAIHVEEYLQDPEHHDASQLLLVADHVTVSEAVKQALHEADVLVLGPSSRTLAVDPVLRTPGFLELVPDGLPVLAVRHDDPAPADLVRVAGLGQPDPGAARPAPAEARAVLDMIREVSA